MPEIEEEGPSEIKEQQNPAPPLKKQKLEGGGAEGKYGADSVEEAVSSEFEEEEDEDEDEGDIERRAVKFYKDRNASERLINLVRSSLSNPRHPDLDYLADGETEVNWALWDEYSKQAVETEGFGLKVDPGCCDMANARPAPDFKESDSFYKLVTEFSDLAIKEYNKNNIGKEFKLVDVEWVVQQLSRGIMYLLTFQAEDALEGVKTFEAKVLDGIVDEKPEVFLCRMKKQTDA